MEEEEEEEKKPHLQDLVFDVGPNSAFDYRHDCWF